MAAAFFVPTTAIAFGLTSTLTVWETPGRTRTATRSVSQAPASTVATAEGDHVCVRQELVFSLPEDGRSP